MSQKTASSPGRGVGVGSSRSALPIPHDPDERARLYDEAMLTPDERQAIDQWCYDEQRERAQGVVSSDEAGRK